jgi:hypothetical protein
LLEITDDAHKPLSQQNMNCSAFFEFGYFKLKLGLHGAKTISREFVRQSQQVDSEPPAVASLNYRRS